MLDPLRTGLHKIITTPVGDGFLPLRVPKVIARRVNMFLGSPLCSPEELDKRRAAQKRLQELRASGTAQPIAREPAPVTVYFEKDRNQRMMDRIEEALHARKIAFTKLDVSGDEATMDFITRTAFQAGATLIDLRLLCRENTDYSGLSPIEPSAAGGGKIARAIVDAVLASSGGSRVLG